MSTLREKLPLGLGGRASAVCLHTAMNMNVTNVYFEGLKKEVPCFGGDFNVQYSQHKRLQAVGMPSTVTSESFLMIRN